MRIVAISDTHGMQAQFGPDIPACDVLVHAGDITMHGEVNELYDISQWLNQLPATTIIVIAGNHDKCFQTERHLAEQTLLQGSSKIIYLRDESVVIDGLKFYGSPWQPAFCNWYFNLPRNGPELEACWDQIPDDTDVLITHGPPMGILDKNYWGEHCGCERMLPRVHAVEPKVHIFGHIHHGYGQLLDVTLFVNAAIADEKYELSNEPIVIDV